LAIGSQVDLRPPFFKKGKSLPSRSEIVKEFSPQFNVDIPDLVDILREVEDSEKENIGPMSPFLPYEQDGPQKVQAVYSDKSTRGGFDARAWERACEWLDSQFHGSFYDLSSIDDAISGERAGQEEEDLDTGMDTSTNSGDPYYLSGWKPTVGTDPKRLPETKAAFMYYRDRVATLTKELNDREASLPVMMAIMGQRLVQKNPEKANKRKRLIIAFPKWQAIIWKLITPQMMEGIRQWKSPGGVPFMVGWTNLTDIDINLQLMLRIAEQNGRTVLSGDVSNYDSSLQAEILFYFGMVIAIHSSDHKMMFE
jgi:hypothetical protein